MTTAAEPPEPELDEHGHPVPSRPTVPGLLVVPADIPVETIALDAAKKHPLTCRVKCARCRWKERARGQWRALAALYAHQEACPNDPAVAAARATARAAASRPPAATRP